MLPRISKTFIASSGKCLGQKSLCRSSNLFKVTSQSISKNLSLATASNPSLSFTGKNTYPVESSSSIAKRFFSVSGTSTSNSFSEDTPKLEGLPLSKIKAIISGLSLETKEEFLFHLSKKQPTIFFRENGEIFHQLTTIANPEKLKETLLNIIENIDKDEYESLCIFTKLLPKITQDPDVQKEAALAVTKKDPAPLLENLSSLSLTREAVQDIISSFLPNPSFPQKMLNLPKPETYTLILKELPLLSLDSDFYEKTILDISKLSPLSFEGVFPFLSIKEERLQGIIRNIVDLISRRDERWDLKNPPSFIQQLQSLNLTNADFVNDILLKISSVYGSYLQLSDFQFSDEKTFISIIKNLIQNQNNLFELDEFIKQIIKNKIKNKENLYSICYTILSSNDLNCNPEIIRKLVEPSSENGLPLFIDTLGITDLSARKKIAVDLLNFIIDEKLQSNVDLLSTNFAVGIDLLGLNQQDLFEDVLLSALKTNQIQNSILQILYYDFRIGDRIRPSLFLKKWELETQSTELNLETISQSKQLVLQFFQEVENTNTLSLSAITTLFKNHIIKLLFKLDRIKDATFDQKLEKLIKACLITENPSASLEERIANIISLDITSSDYDYEVFFNRLNQIARLIHNNPALLEKIALDISKKKAEYIPSTIDVFNIKNTQTLESIGVNILLKSRLYFERYLTNVNFPKDALLRIYNQYSLELYKEGSCILSPEVTNEVFEQINRYRNESLSRDCLTICLNGIKDLRYQKAFGSYTLNTKPKEPPIFVHKILPSLFFAKWDLDLSEDLAPFRKILFDFLGNSAIRKALRNATQPLIQNILFAAVAVDKDGSLTTHSRLRLFAQVCNLEQKDTTPSIEELSDNLRTLRFICSLCKGKNLDYIFANTAKKELVSVFHRLIIDNSIIPNLKKTENIESKYIKIFIKEALIPGGLSTYEAGFRQLIDRNEHQIIHKDFLSDLSRFAEICLEEKSNERYRTDLHPDLKKLSEQWPKVFEGWKTSLPPIELEILKNSPGGKPINNFNFIFEINQQLLDYKQSPITINLAKNLRRFTVASSIKEQFKLIEYIEKDLYQLDPIPMDAIKRLEQAPIPTERKQKIKLLDIDNPLTLFEMPTLVSITCQSLTANPLLNQCLIGYALDGGVRMMGIQDTLGKFIARAVYRIYFDKENKPFLLLETVYSSNKISEEAAKQVIYEGGLQKALSLNIPIFTTVSNHIGISKIIQSEGRSVGIYYSDLATNPKTSYSHCIAGKQPHTLEATSLVQITEETFERPLPSSKTSS